MKLTATQLRRIIKEAVQKAMGNPYADFIRYRALDDVDGMEASAAEIKKLAGTTINLSTWQIIVDGLRAAAMYAPEEGIDEMEEIAFKIMHGDIRYHHAYMNK